MKNKKFLLFNMAVLFALVATVLIGKNNLDTNYETMEPTKIADEKIENELSEKEQKELEKKRERIHKKLRGEISELKPKKLSKKKKFLLFNIAVLFAIVATVIIDKNNLDNNNETMEPKKKADEKIENELSEKEQKELEKKRERIHKKLRGEISELKPKKLSKKK